MTSLHLYPVEDFINSCIINNIHTEITTTCECCYWYRNWWSPHYLCVFVYLYSNTLWKMHIFLVSSFLITIFYLKKILVKIPTPSHSPTPSTHPPTLPPPILRKDKVPCPVISKWLSCFVSYTLFSDKNTCM